MVKIGQALRKLRSGKIFAGIALVAVIVAFGGNSIASAAPSYFNVDKPSSPSQCEGFTTTSSWEWRWEHSKNGPWWTWFFFGHWVKVDHQTPNWQKLGFKSKAQCIRYTSTPAPKNRHDCDNGNWFTLGFNNRGQCIRYVRLHGGGGYGG